MFSHYFITAIRNIRKSKISFFINMAGLSLGLASAFIISSYVLKETSFDRFHSKKDRIARVLYHDLNLDWRGAMAPYVMKECIDNSMPAVEKSCMLDLLHMAKVKQGDEYFKFKELYASTPEFFDIFDCKVLSGNVENSLKDINSLVITRNVAEKYFPNENPVGKTLEVKIDSEIYQLIVDAVIEHFPQNSSFKFDALCNINISVKRKEAKPWSAGFKTSWKSLSSRMFLLLKDNNLDEFQTAWDQFEKENNIGEQEIHFYLQALIDIHLNSEQIINDGRSNHGNKMYIYLFSSIAFVILLVAAFNYIILSISISKTRYKEIGVKKILGCQNSLIRKQFLIESILLSIIAFPIAYVLAYYSVDFLNQLFNISLEINIFKKLDQLLAFLFLLITIGALAGSYIAFYLSGLNPLEIIKSKLGNQNKKIRFQYVMLLFQIIVFTGLTGASFSIYKQIHFLKNIDLGINYENKLRVQIDDFDFNNSSYQTVSNILSEIPEVKGFTFGFLMSPGNDRAVTTATHPEDETKKIKYEDGYISFGFFDFFDIKNTKGRFFNSKYKDDSSKIILNETAVKQFGFKNPIGKIINKKEIIGVVEDFHLHSLHEGVAPSAYSLIPPDYVHEIVVEYQEGLEDLCSEKIKQELGKFIPDTQIEIISIEAIIEGLYSEDNNLNNIIIYFSLFAIIIALIGIFGQSLFAVKQQVKEIGIRKVNGASSRDIIIQVLRKYILLCVIANLMSWPIVYILVEKWQEVFVYKSPLSMWLILFTLCASVIVVLGTVVINAWKASRTNPVHVLKYE